jgi:hypothetical protein
MKENKEVSAQAKKYADSQGFNVVTEMPPQEKEKYNDYLRAEMENLRGIKSKPFKMDGDWNNVYLPKFIVKDTFVDWFTAKSLREGNTYPMVGYTHEGNLYITHFADIAIYYRKKGVSNLRYTEIPTSEVRKYSNVEWVNIADAEVEHSTGYQTKIYNP